MKSMEAKLWDYIKVLFQNRFYILLCIIVAMITVFVVNLFFIDKKYETSMWINVNENFLSQQKEISMQYIESYFLYPEVVKPLLQSTSTITKIQTSISFKEVNGLIKIAYLHRKDSTISAVLENWIWLTMLKMIHEEGQRLSKALKDELVSVGVQLEKETTKLGEMADLKVQMQRDIDTVLTPNDKGDSDIYIIREESSAYSDLCIQENNTKIAVVDLTSQRYFLQQTLTDYQNTLAAVKQALQSANPEISEQLLNDLQTIRSKYNAFRQQKDANATLISIHPFEIVSEPFTLAEPVSPNIGLSLCITAVLSFIAGSILVFVFHFIQTMRKREHCDVA